MPEEWPSICRYLKGRTPNPCIACNRYVKWESLLERSLAIGADYIATGHYARVKKLANGRYAICRSATAQKDQTYALYNLTQYQLAHTLMPIGDYEKAQIREMADKLGLPVAHKPDSQEICFIPDNDYAAFIDRQAKGRVPGPGNFVTPSGDILAVHKGITHYTVGQRKGLNLAMGHPVFVTRICPDTNEVVIGESEDVFSSRLFCNKINYMGAEDLPEPQRVTAKIRYGHKACPCTIEKAGEDKIKCTFDAPVRAVTPGQAVVFYKDDYVMGGGTIRQYEYNWGKKIEINQIPQNITQEELVVVLERIVETGESVIVGRNKCRCRDTVCGKESQCQF